MYFFPEGDLFCPLWVPGGDWGKNHSRSFDVPADKMPSRQALYTVGDFAARGYRAMVRCPCGWEGEMALPARLNTRSPMDMLWREVCGRCGGGCIELVELVPPADIEGLALDLLPDDAYDADPVYPDEVDVAGGLVVVGGFDDADGAELDGLSGFLEPKEGGLF